LLLLLFFRAADGASTADQETDNNNKNNNNKNNNNKNNNNNNKKNSDNNDIILCDHASVGAGPAGVYHAWRLATHAGTPPNTTICLFERLNRVGGRVASLLQAGPKGDLVVEPGAYRFCPDKICGSIGGKKVCLWTPLVGALITDALKLKSKRYNPNSTEFDHHLYKIVDEVGEDAGFAQYVWGMLQQLEAVAAAKGITFRLFLGHSLESIA
ncbi:unnamed protein product, partial [Polarella glacialis]